MMYRLCTFLMKNFLQIYPDWLAYLVVRPGGSANCDIGHQSMRGFLIISTAIRKGISVLNFKNVDEPVPCKYFQRDSIQNRTRLDAETELEWNSLTIFLKLPYCSNTSSW